MNWRHLFSQRIRWVHGGLLALCLLTGCSYKWYWLDPDNCSTIPPGALPRPNGSSVRDMMEVQAANAAADDFVIYLHFWAYEGDGTTFGPFGQWQWNEIVRRLPTVPFPIVIQPNGHDKLLDEARRLCLINQLGKLGFADAPHRVIIATPIAEALYGVEAPRITEEMFISPWGHHHHGWRGGFGFDDWGHGGHGGAGWGGGVSGWGSGFGSINRWNGYGVGYFNAAPGSRLLQMR
jgi:hypothetical protein